MNMTKKVISVVLAVLMVVSMMSVMATTTAFAATLEDGYYLIGINGWSVEDLTEADMFTSTNPADTDEYMMAITVSDSKSVKAVKVEDNTIKTWYPDGDNNNKSVAAGSHIIYFKPGNGEHPYVKTTGEISNETELKLAAANGGEWKLADDFAVTETITITDKTLVLDLAGKSITADLPKSTVFSLSGTASLTVNDTVGTGVIENTGSSNNNAKVIALYNTSSFTLNNGTIKGAKKTVYGIGETTITINGGTVTTSASGGHGAINSSGTVTVTGGKLEASSDNFALTGRKISISGGEISAKKYGVYFSTTSSGAVLSITGGTITSTDSYPVFISASANAPVTVKGATINAPEGVDPVGFSATTKSYVTSDSDTAVIGSLDYAFIVDGKYYGINALNATSASTLKLEKDVTLTSDITIQNNVTLDLNGHTISRAGDAAKPVAAIIVNGAYTVTFKDTVGGGKITAADISGTDDKGANAIRVNAGATVNVKGGKYEVTGDNDNATVYVMTASATKPVTVNISGGRFEASNHSASGGNDYLINVKDSIRDYVTINVTGGSFEGFNPQDNKAEGAGTNIVDPAYAAVADTNDGDFTIADAVAKIGNKGYSTVAAAIAAAVDGDKIELLDDVNIGSEYYYVDKDVTFDLGGNTITGADSFIIAEDGANVEIKNGTVTSTIANDYVLYVRDGATLKIADDAVIEATNASGNAVIAKNGGTADVYGEVDAEYYGIAVIGNSTVNVYDGAAITSTNASAISGNGSGGNEGYTINVKGGTLTSTNDVAIYHPNQGTLNITGGTITGRTAIYIKSGSTDVSTSATSINGATIRGTGAQTAMVHSGNGCNPTGDAIVIENCGYPGGTPAIGISGGTIISDNAQDVGSYAYGTNSATGEAYEPITGFVSGGSFKHEVPAEQCAEDYKPAPLNTATGYYEVVQKDYVAQIGTKGYETIAEAIDAAQDGDTIELLTDVNIGSSYYYVDKSVTFDLNGKTVTGVDSFIIATGGANVEIKNGTVTSTIANDYVLYVRDGATLKIADDAVIEATNASGYAVIAKNGGTADVYGKVDAVYYGIVVIGNSTVNVYDGAAITSTNACAISGNGSSGNEGYTINVEGGTLTSTNDVAIYHPNQGTLNITGGTITGRTAIYIKSGSTDVSTSATSIDGATIRGTGAPVAFAHSGNGCNPTGDAIVIENCGYPGGTPAIGISGGTITSEQGAPVNSIGYSTYPQVKNFISGGSFDEVVPEEYCANGYKPVTTADSNNMYTVTPKTFQEIANEAFGSVTINPIGGYTQTFSNTHRAELLGVQLRNEPSDGTYTEGDNSTYALRYIAAVDEDLLDGASDYGFMIGVNNKWKFYSVKESTRNNVIADGDGVKFFTAAVYDIQDGDRDTIINVRFAIKKGTVAYATYAKASDDYTLSASYNKVVEEGKKY